MKKIFTRLRHWLIKKLGGYTEQFTPIQRQSTRTVNVPTQKVQVQTSVGARELDSTIDFKRYCEKRMLDRLVQSLYQSGLILWERQDDIFEQKVNMRATLYVVNAEDLKPEFQCRVE